ncbi:hypothetical protein [Asaia krungthepensis]|uniref:Uncharacterized protein n=1 Tax=Asaia krungthepensis NRIC 0535 TaxID=1307925 RepID=A0ABQ0Q6F0_9PROT|nr:hypothetical protein [Asaia krungthepensis]GBQ93515.1 hypothetical protein AA0535_2853 [Asaia krungthepensis NRIC 0535]
MSSLPQHRALWRYALTDLTGLAFAALWGLRGLRGLGWAFPLDLTIIMVISAPLIWGFLARDLSQGRPEIIIDRALAQRVKRLRVLLLFLAGMTLSVLHRPDLMLVVFGLVIGASYIPLGRAMAEPVHGITGLAILVVTLFALMFPPPLHLILAGLGTATSLWLGAAARLWGHSPASSGKTRVATAGETP